MLNLKQMNFETDVDEFVRRKRGGYKLDTPEREGVGRSLCSGVQLGTLSTLDQSLVVLDTG